MVEVGTNYYIIIHCVVLTCYLEDDEVLVAGPDHVGVHGALLGVARHPGVGALVTNQR